MLCKFCNEDRKDDDFLLNSDECYKCVYKRKTAVKEPPPLEKDTKCKICGDKVKPPKTVFCCEECAGIGWQKQRKDYWPRKISSQANPFNRQCRWKIES